MDVRVINELVQKQSAFIDKLTAEVGKVIVGQKAHGRAHPDRPAHRRPRAARRRARPGQDAHGRDPVRHRSRCKFQRIQFTPDLLPADIVGTVIYNQQHGEFTVQAGARSSPTWCWPTRSTAPPPRCSRALLEAMQERQVTIGDKTYPLPEPFLVMATQNPIEQEGTYPLPEAQLDRFMLMIKVGYPTREEERAIMDRMTVAASTPSAERGRHARGDRRARAASCSEVYIDEKINDYIVDVVLATREPKAHGLKDLADFIEFGASPRASIALNLAARAHAFLRHRGYVTPEDVKADRPRRAAPPRRSSPTRPRPRRSPPRQIVRSCSSASKSRKGPAPSPHRHAAPRAAQADPQDRDRDRNGWSRDQLAGSTTRSSRAAASRSPRCASTSPATTCASSTGTSPRA